MLRQKRAWLAWDLPPPGWKVMALPESLFEPLVASYQKVSLPSLLSHWSHCSFFFMPLHLVVKDFFLLAFRSFSLIVALKIVVILVCLREYVSA